VMCVFVCFCICASADNDCTEPVSAQVCIFSVHTCVSVFVHGESHGCSWELCLSNLCADGELRCLETCCDVYVWCVCVGVCRCVCV